MDPKKRKIDRPVALVILDGWGYAPRTESNAIAMAHTPYYDEICRNFPMTVLSAAGDGPGQADDERGSPEVGHLNLGTGRNAMTEVARIRKAIQSGEFQKNAVLNRAYAKAKANGSAVHLIGLLSDAGVHSSMENLFACLRLAKQHGLENVFIHCILDGVDVPERTADIYVEALEIKLAEIGVGRVATLCGRFFAMDNNEKWERTARAFTLLVHAEGERTHDAVTAIRNSFLRGISDEFISPIVVERAPDTPVTRIGNGDLVVFFNHRPETMRQLVRSLCVPEGESGAKPVVETVCLTEYDRAFNLPAAFRQEPEKNTLTQVLSELEIPNVKITEASRMSQMTHYFDGGAELPQQAEHEIIVGPANITGDIFPESQSFKITDKFRQLLQNVPNGVFVINVPAADLMGSTGDMDKTVAAVQYVDTCIGGICEGVRDLDGVVLLTSTHGNCEDMVHPETGEPNPLLSANPVPFHFIDYQNTDVRLQDAGSLADVAPTLLAALNIPKPTEMTGDDLRIS